MTRCNLAGLALACWFVPLAGCGGWTDRAFCASEGCGWTDREWQAIASLSPLPDPPIDTSNGFVGSRDVDALGKRLYFDTSFSGVGRQVDVLGRPVPAWRVPEKQPLEMSCASCHDLARGGGDAWPQPGNVSAGAGVTDVNAQSPINAVYHRTVFWNGRADSLWALNVVVAESAATMNGNRLHTAHVLADRYAAEVGAAFGGALPADWVSRVRAWPDAGKPGVPAYDALPDEDRQLATTLLVLWSKAIAVFEHGLVSKDAPFDRFVKDGPSSTAISESAKRGARLFVGKAGCVDCHSGPLLSDEDFHDVGAPQIGPAVPTVRECVAKAPCDCVNVKNCLPWGAYNGLQTLQDTDHNPWLRVTSAYSADKVDPIPELRRRPLGEELKGAWRTPGLRDVALTAPYMHDGAFRTLEEVIWHYNDGGRASRPYAVGTPSARLKPLGLSAGEVADLVDFLRSLTGAALSQAAPP